jgi:hypothetical protein
MQTLHPMVPLFELFQREKHDECGYESIDCAGFRNREAEKQKAVDFARRFRLTRNGVHRPACRKAHSERRRDARQKTKCYCDSNATHLNFPPIQLLHL